MAHRYGRVIDLNTVFRNHLFKITQTQRIRHVPAHTSQDHVQREMQPSHNFGHARPQRLARNPFLLHRGFWQIFIRRSYPVSLSRQNQRNYTSLHLKIEKTVRTNGATSFLDRLMHHCHLLEFDGRSNRLKEAAETLARKSKTS
ncbi:hypothetical protein SBC2_76650 (plasmid) [Caballeronia sp. SBC2]|nr:hypothetical protein SBC2_76650 [Caballeronia sp. SBC2]